MIQRKRTYMHLDSKRTYQTSWKRRKASTAATNSSGAGNRVRATVPANRQNRGHAGHERDTGADH